MSSYSTQPGDSDDLAMSVGESAENTEETRTQDTAEREPPGESGEDQPERPSPVSQLSPEAQGEMNGGPLGCCLGVMIGLVVSVCVPLISRALGDPLIAVLGGGWLSLLVRVLMGLVAFVAVMICGRVGWKIGKRIYREYPSPVVRVRQRGR